MTSGELRRAVEGPAGRVGLFVEPELVDALVDDLAGEDGGLPLLSTALLDLWVARENRTLTRASYERTGGVRGAVGRHAEQAFRLLDPERRELARDVLVRLAAGGAGEPLTRRAATRAARRRRGRTHRQGRLHAGRAAQPWPRWHSRPPRTRRWPT